MTRDEILKADLLDILFENRNKAYGAYHLRKYYNFRLSMALAIALSGALLAFLLIKPGSSKTMQSLFTPDSVQLVDVVIPPQEQPVEEPQTQPQSPQQKQVVSTVQHTPINIVKDNVAPETEVPPQDFMVDKLISNATNIGNPATNMDHLPSVNSSGTGDGIIEEKNVLEFTEVDQKPEFPGGMDALRNFLSRFLRHPDELEANEMRTVYVKFVVSIDGSVTDFQIIRSAGNVFDNEVLRVLKKMPKWQAAKHKGKNVPVTFTQPVTFKGIED